MLGCVRLLGSSIRRQRDDGSSIVVQSGFYTEYSNIRELENRIHVVASLLVCDAPASGDICSIYGYRSLSLFLILRVSFLTAMCRLFDNQPRVLTSEVGS